jgi:prophage regulatory protein
MVQNEPKRLPITGFMRVSQILEFVPVSRSCWWNGVKEGRFPKPIKLSPKVTVWRAADIAALTGDAPAPKR